MYIELYSELYHDGIHKFGLPPRISKINKKFKNMNLYNNIMANWFLTLGNNIILSFPENTFSRMFSKKKEHVTLILAKLPERKLSPVNKAMDSNRIKSLGLSEYVNQIRSLQ